MQAGFVVDSVLPADIDETPHKGELPCAHASRLARQKAAAIAAEHAGAGVILASDTVVACGRRILPKAEDEKTARECLKQLSGKRHRVHTAVAVVHLDGKTVEKLVTTQVKFRRLSEADIAHYIISGEWQGKAGGYAIQGLAASFIPWINGSYSAVVGLPLSETAQLLQSAGVSARQHITRK